MDDNLSGFKGKFTSDCEKYEHFISSKCHLLINLACGSTIHVRASHVPLFMYGHHIFLSLCTGITCSSLHVQESHVPLFMYEHHMFHSSCTSITCSSLHVRASHVPLFMYEHHMFLSSCTSITCSTLHVWHHIPCRQPGCAEA